MEMQVLLLFNCVRRCSRVFLELMSRTVGWLGDNRTKEKAP